MKKRKIKTRVGNTSTQVCLLLAITIDTGFWYDCEKWYSLQINFLVWGFQIIIQKYPD